jgi:N-acetylglucosamine-6-phosphate deacetylase
MSQIIIKNAKIVLLSEIRANYSVLIENGRIAMVAPTTKLKQQADQIIDAQGDYLAPGFIDLHFHGSGGYLIDNGSNSLAALCAILPKFGVTGFLAGVSPLPKGEDVALLTNLARTKSEGAAVLGFHLEGPFLSLYGAIPPDTMGKADIERVEALIKAVYPYKAVFSISPDVENITELLPLMGAHDTPVFMTHTAATVKQTQAAINAGVCHATHFYDVFPCPPVTDPGVRPCGAVEAVLADPRVSVDFILDGEHVDPVAVQMALCCKGPDKVCLITDANIGAAMPPGRYKFFKDEVVFAYPGGPARFSEHCQFAGGLCGSGLTMNLAVGNAIKMLGVDLPQAVRMASTNPARVLKLSATKGQITENFDADLVLLNDSLEVRQTWIQGKRVF